MSPSPEQSPPPPKLLLLDHVVLEVRDPLGSLAFYQAILGTEPVRQAEFEQGDAPFPSARVGQGTIIDFFPPAMWRDKVVPANPNHVCLTTDQATAEAVEQRLAAREVPVHTRRPRTFGAQGYGTSYYFNDPDGVTIEVRYYPAQGE